VNEDPVSGSADDLNAFAEKQLRFLFLLVLGALAFARSGAQIDYRRTHAPSAAASHENAHPHG
jgi:hypothetical protein